MRRDSPPSAREAEALGGDRDFPLGQHDKSHRANASQFFVAGELCRRGYSAVVTLGNTPNVDVLCSNREGSRFVHIQVKTFEPSRRTCSVGKKAERDYGPSFFWVLAGIPAPDSAKPFEYYVVPSKVLAHEVTRAHQAWLKGRGAKGQARKDSSVRIVHLPPDTTGGWDVSPYHDK